MAAMGYIRVRYAYWCAMCVLCSNPHGVNVRLI